MILDLKTRSTGRDGAAFICLKGNGLGADAAPALRRALKAARSAIKPVRAHTELLPEGDRSDHLFVMVDGWACRYLTRRDGARQIVGLMAPGDVLNPDVLLFARPGYGVRTLTAGSVEAVGRGALRALADDDPAIGLALTRLTLIEAASLRQNALCLGRMSARERVAHLLCELAVRLVGDGPTAISYPLPLTQEEIADVVGLTGVHVNRTMRQLRELGLIEQRHGTMTLPDMRALRALAGFDPAYLHAGTGDGGGPVPRAVRPDPTASTSMM